MGPEDTFGPKGGRSCKVGLNIGYESPKRGKGGWAPV